MVSTAPETENKSGKMSVRLRTVLTTQGRAAVVRRIISTLFVRSAKTFVLSLGGIKRAQVISMSFPSLLKGISRGTKKVQLAFSMICRGILVSHLYTLRVRIIRPFQGFFTSCEYNHTWSVGRISHVGG